MNLCAVFSRWDACRKAREWLAKSTGVSPGAANAPYLFLNDAVHQHLLLTGRTLFGAPPPVPLVFDNGLYHIVRRVDLDRYRGLIRRLAVPGGHHEQHRYQSQSHHRHPLEDPKRYAAPPYALDNADDHVPPVQR